MPEHQIASESSQPVGRPQAPDGGVAGAQRALRALVVDDERNDRETLAAALRLLGCRVDTAENRDGALGRARGEPYDLAFVDLMLGTESGVDLVPALLAANSNLQIIVITAFGAHVNMDDSRFPVFFEDVRIAHDVLDPRFHEQMQT